MERQIRIGVPTIESLSHIKSRYGPRFSFGSRLYIFNETPWEVVKIQTSKFSMNTSMKLKLCTKNIRESNTDLIQFN